MQGSGSKDDGLTSLVFIVVYMGKWPNWFDAFLLSCRNNPSVDWLIFTDCGIPKDGPSNVRFVALEMNELKDRLFRKVELDVPALSIKKLNDLKPAYGHIFDEYIGDYSYWGYCDIDIIWGNIRKFIEPALLSNYDVVTALPHIAGHFTIIKNN